MNKPLIVLVFVLMALLGATQAGTAGNFSPGTHLISADPGIVMISEPGDPCMYVGAGSTIQILDKVHYCSSAGN